MMLVTCDALRQEVCLQSILPQQRLLADEAAWKAVLAIIKDEEVCERLHGRWQRAHGRLTSSDISCERWAELSAEIDKVILRRRSHQLCKAVLPLLAGFLGWCHCCS